MEKEEARKSFGPFPRGIPAETRMDMLGPKPATVTVVCATHAYHHGAAEVMDVEERK